MAEKIIPKCNYDDLDAVIEYQETSESDIAYLCEEHFRFLVGGAEEGIKNVFRLKALNNNGKALLKEFNFAETIDIPIEKPKIKEIKEVAYDVAIKNAIEKYMGIANKDRFMLLESKFKQIIKNEIYPQFQTQMTEKQFAYAFDQIKEKGLGEIQGKNSLLSEANKLFKLAKLDMDLSANQDVFDKFVFSELGFHKRGKQFIVHVGQFTDFYAKYTNAPTILITTASLKQTPEEPITETKKTEELEWYNFNCRQFPDLTGIYTTAHFEACKKFMMEQRRVWIKPQLLKKMFLAIERDTPFILFGEPGDGKSLIIKNFLDWLTFYYNGGADNKSLILKPSTIPLNPNLHGVVPKFGVDWDSRNIDESTNATTLYGGFSPEVLSEKDKSKRRQNIDYGIISEGMMKGYYVFLDELNRTDNEVLGRMMGFLQEPYNYTVPEAKYKYWLKQPPDVPRSNYVIVASMNIGDVGNFKMSFAFKRRFKIIHVKYTKEEIGELAVWAKGYKGIASKIRSAYSVLCSSTSANSMTPIAFVDFLNNTLYEFGLKLFDETHEWAKSNSTQFGAGVAHVFTVLEDISLFIHELLVSKYASLNLFDLLDGIISGAYSQDIENVVFESLDENVKMALVDENDKFKMSNIEAPTKALAHNLFQKIQLIFATIKRNINGSYSNKIVSECPEFLLLMKLIFKFHKRDKDL